MATRIENHDMLPAPKARRLFALLCDTAERVTMANPDIDGLVLVVGNDTGYKVIVEYNRGPLAPEVIAQNVPDESLEAVLTTIGRTAGAIRR